MALSSDFARQRRTGDLTAIPLAAGEEVFAGSIVVQIGGLGYAGKAGTGSVIGMARGHYSNTGGANGDVTAECERGIYLYTMAGATAADTGKTCYVLDDDTVTLTDTGNIEAGKIFAVHSDTSVWVDMR